MNTDNFKKVLLFLFAITLFCCSSISSDRSSKPSDFYPDSVFKYHSRKFIFDDSLGQDYNKETMEFNLHKLSANDRELLTDPILGARFYGAYFYSKQNKIKEKTPILVLANADDYQSIILFVVSDEVKVTGHLALTADACDVIEQTDQKEIVSCHQRDSEFLNDSTIRVTDLEILIDGYGKSDEITTTDSLIIDYRITSAGFINQIQKDSIRYVKRKN